MYLKCLITKRNIENNIILLEIKLLKTDLKISENKYLKRSLDYLKSIIFNTISKSEDFFKLDINSYRHINVESKTNVKKETKTSFIDKVKNLFKRNSRIYLMFFFMKIS